MKVKEFENFIDTSNKLVTDRLYMEFNSLSIVY